MIRLSYTSLNNLRSEQSHEWINRVMGIPVPEYPFLKEGKEAHRIIQQHLSGEKKHPALKDITVTFPVVEREDFDENCKFSFPFKTTKDTYEIMGYVDGLDDKNKRLLEIKTSTTDWTVNKFRNAMQRKIYALAFPDYTEAYLITGSKDPEIWKRNAPKLYSMKLTDEDREDAKEWIIKAIRNLESGNFTGGLDESGHCTGCFWNMPRYRELANCHFI